MAQSRTLVFTLLLSGCVCTPLHAAEPQGTAPAAEIGIVFRFSSMLFDDMTRDEIEMTIPIDHRVEKVSLSGKASGKAMTKIVMHDSDNVAAFVLGAMGNAVGTMNADVGPANVHLTSRATFSVEKQISFDGDTFHQSPTVTVSRNCSSVDRICAKRGGLVGRVVERIGKRVARKSLREINSEAQQMTEDILAIKFDEATDALVKELNIFTPFQEVVDKLFPETNDWTMRTATKSNHLLAGFGPRDSKFPAQFLGPPAEPTALAELWLRITPAQAILLQIVSEMDAGYDVLREVMPDEHAKAIADDVKLVRRGDWSVIQIGIDEVSESP